MTTVIMNPHDMRGFCKETYFSKLTSLLETYALDKQLYDSVAIDPNPQWVTGGQRHDFETGLHTYRVQNLPAGVYHFHGNFIGYSFSFNIYTDDNEVIELLSKAITTNTNKPSYQSQPDEPYPPSAVEVWSNEIITDWATSLNPKHYTLFA
jgi:hypothetical protein